MTELKEAVEYDVIGLSLWAVAVAIERVGGVTDKSMCALSRRSKNMKLR